MCLVDFSFSILLRLVTWQHRPDHLYFFVIMCGCVFYSKDDVNSTFFMGGGGGGGGLLNLVPDCKMFHICLIIPLYWCRCCW